MSLYGGAQLGACLLPQYFPLVRKGKRESRSPAGPNFLPVYLETWFLLAQRQLDMRPPVLISASHLPSPRALCSIELL